MSYKYGEVVEAIKKTKNEELKLPKFVKIIITLCSVFLLVYIIGTYLLGKNINLETAESICGFVAMIVGLIGTIICVVVFHHCKKTYEPIEKTKIQNYLDSLVTALQHCGIETQQDISDLQAEIERSRLKSEKNLTQVVSGTKYVFGIVCVSPIGFLLAAFWGGIFSSAINDTNVQEIWNLLLLLMGALLLCGIMLIALFIILWVLIYIIRESWGIYAQREQVYDCLEDMKYRFRAQSEQSDSGDKK